MTKHISSRIWNSPVSSLYSTALLCVNWDFFKPSPQSEANISSFSLFFLRCQTSTADGISAYTPSLCSFACTLLHHLHFKLHHDVLLLGESRLTRINEFNLCYLFKEKMLPRRHGIWYACDAMECRVLDLVSSFLILCLIRG
jgi:hypothetical protein